MALEWLFPAILLILGIWITLTHRRLTQLRRDAVMAWEPLEALLRQRHGLVAPLVQTVRTHAPEGRKLTEALIQARQAAQRMDLSPNATGEAEIRFATAMQRVLMFAQAHPDLAGEVTFRRIQAGFDELDKDIAAARDDFNARALTYNRAATTAPSILVARYANLLMLEYFALEDEERRALQVAGLARSP
jgi:hypothetical protein